MYQCKGCSTSFETQKRYLDHLSICSVITKSRSSKGSSNTSKVKDHDTDHESESSMSTSMTSARRSRSTFALEQPGYLSDTHASTGVSGMSGINTSLIEKLERYTQDRERLKAEVKKYKAKLKKQEEDSKAKQEYFESQIASLTEERDDTHEQVDKMNDTIFKEKERLRTEFNRKLAEEKKKLTSIYSGKNNLQNIVEKLESEINRLKDEHENTMFLMTSQHQDAIRELEERLLDLKKTSKAEKDDLTSKLQKALNDSNTLMYNLNKDKQAEIDMVNSENKAAVNTLQAMVQSLRKDLDTCKVSNQKIIAEIENKYKLELEDKNNTITMIKENHSRTIDLFNERKHGEIALIRAEYEKKISELGNSHEVRFMNVQREKDITLVNTKQELEKYQEKYNKMEAEYQAKLEQTRNDMNYHLEQKTSEFNRIVENMRVDHENSLITIKEKLTKEYEDIITTKNTAIAEIEKTNHMLGMQMTNLKSSVSMVSKDTESIKEQFTSSLNKQKLEYDMLIRDKDDQIRSLNDTIEKLNVKYSYAQSSSKNLLSNLESELDNTRDSNRSLNTRLTTLSQEYDKLLNKHTDLVKKHVSDTENLRDEFNRKLQTRQSEYEQEGTRRVFELTSQLDSANQELDLLRKSSAGELEKVRSEYEKKLYLLRTELESNTIRKVGEISFTLEKTQAELEDVKKQTILSLNDQRTEFLDKLRKKEEECRLLSNEVQEYKDYDSEWSNQVNELACKNREYQDQIMHLNSKVKQLEETIRIRDEQLAMVDRQQDKLNDKIQELLLVNKELASVPSLNEKAKILEKELLEKDARLNKVNGKYKSIKVEYERMTQDLSLIKSRHADEIRLIKESHASTVETMEFERKKLEEGADTAIENITLELDKQKDLYTRLSADLAKRNEQIESLKTISGQLNMQVTGLMQRIKQQTDEHQKEIARIRQEAIDKVSGDKVGQEKDMQLSKYVTELDILTKENRELTRKLEQAKESCLMEDKLKRVRDEALESLRRQKEENGQLKLDNVRLNREFEQFKERYDTYEKSIKAEIDEYKLGINKLSQKISALDSEIASKNERINQLEKMLDSSIKKVLEK